MYIYLVCHLLGISRFTAPAPSAPKGDSKFEILLVKILGLKQKKTKSNTSKC